MAGINFSMLAFLLGLMVVLPAGYGVLRPEALGATARKFSRHTPTGVALMMLATAWFIFNVSQEPLSDFTRLKTPFLLLFAAVGLGTCIFVHDFLAVRGLAVLALLLAKLMVDTARWAHSDWRLVVVVWAYLLVVAGMWLTLSPWRLRDWIGWLTASPQRTRLFSGARLAFGLLLIVLSLTAYRAG